MNQRAAQVALSLIRDGRTQDMQEMTMKQAELEKVHVEIVKLLSEQRKLNAEAGKMTRETFWYPVAVATGLIGTVATITTVLIKLL
jgi:ClpP class serine protease